MWVSPAQWGHHLPLAFGIAGLGSLVVHRSARSDVTLAFLVAWAAVLFGRAWLVGQAWVAPLHQLENGSLTLFAIRAPTLKSDGGFELVSRESFLLLNNALLVAAACLILVGELWPLLMDAFDLGKISVGPPYFNLVFLVPTVPLVLLLGVGMHAGWRRALLKSRQRVLLTLAAVAAVLAVTIALAAYGSAGVPLTVVGFAAGLFVMASALIEPIEQWRRGKKLPRAALGMAIAHFGVGVFVMGITGVVSYKVEKDVSLAPGESAEVSGYTFKYEGTHPVAGPNYEAVEARIPQLAVLLQPVGHVLQRARLNLARPRLRLAGPQDQPTALEHLDVLRDGLDRHVERLGELVDRRGPRRQPGEDRAPRRIGEGRVGGAEMIGQHAVTNRSVR